MQFKGGSVIFSKYQPWPAEAKQVLFRNWETLIRKVGFGGICYGTKCLVFIPFAMGIHKPRVFILSTAVFFIFIVMFMKVNNLYTRFYFEDAHKTIARKTYGYLLFS